MTEKTMNKHHESVELKFNRFTWLYRNMLIYKKGYDQEPNAYELKDIKRDASRAINGELLGILNDLRKYTEALMNKDREEVESIVLTAFERAWMCIAIINENKDKYGLDDYIEEQVKDVIDTLIKYLRIKAGRRKEVV